MCHACQVDPLADEIVRLIVTGTIDRRLKWIDQDRVRVVIARGVPRIGPAGQRLGPKTLRARRQRAMHAIGARLSIERWTIRTVKEPNTYEPAPPRG